jgi:ERCC4-type nuclease
MAPGESRKKAKHAANQEALDRLYDKCDQANNVQGSKFVYTVRKAVKSLQACPTAVTTIKEAKALHGVGDSLARVIILKAKETSASLSLSRASSITSSASAAAAKNSESTTKLKRKDPPPPPPPDGKMEASKPSEKHKAYRNAVKASETLQLPTDDWKVILIVDGREHGWEKVLAKLQMSGVPSEKRNLPIGDMAWIARSGTTEIMLGTIVERKEVNDLASSLFGTRYNEQRLRLQHCGLPQVFLLVEGDTKDVTNCPHENLIMAMMETRVQLDFQVVQTRHLEDTVRFLKSVHRRILQRAFPSAFGAGETVTESLPTFSSPSANRRRRRKSIKKLDKSDRRSFEQMLFDKPPEPPFGASRFITYNELKCKVEKDREEGTKTIGAIFCGMLKQVPRVSNNTVPPLVHAYPTPDALFRALDGLNVSEGKNLVAELETGTQRVGDQKALEIYYTFMAGGDDNVFAAPQPAVALTENKTLAATQFPAILETAPNIVSKTSYQAANDVIERAAALPVIQEAAPRSHSKNSSHTAQDTIELLDSPTQSDQEVVPSQLSHDSWEKWEELPTPKRLKTLNTETTRSVDNFDLEMGRSLKKASLASANLTRDSVDTFNLEIAKFKATSRARAAPLDLSQSSDDDDMKLPGDSVTRRPSFRKRPLASHTAVNSDSEEEEPLGMRIQRLRETLNSAKESTKPDPKSTPQVKYAKRSKPTVAQEVSISTDEEAFPSIQPEIIELSD